MPLFYQHTINERAALAVWHITEEENFFDEKINIPIAIRHPHKRLQHMAGRYLLHFLMPGFPVHDIEILSSKKPYLKRIPLHFSISHCGGYAAAIISTDKVAGIDVEEMNERIFNIQNKFLTRDEIMQLPETNKKWLTICWSAKEAVYKWYGRGGIDFKNDMRIEKITEEDDEQFVRIRFLKNSNIVLKVHYLIFEELVLVWVVHYK